MIELSIIIPHRGNRDFCPLTESVQHRHVEIIPIKYDCAVWNISRAANIGIKKAKGKIVAKADADLVLPHGFIDDALGAGDAFCVAPVKRQKEGQDLRGVWDNPIWADLKSWYWPCGGWQSAPKEFWFDLHGYDEDMIFYGADDTDMWNRAHGSGLSVEILNPVLHRWHKVLAHDWSFYHAGNAKLRERRIDRPVRNVKGWGGASFPKPGNELARWLLNVIKIARELNP